MHDNNKRSVIWNIGQPDAKKSSELAKKLGISEFLAKLLVAKGIDDADEALKFMNCDYMLLHDPFLLPDMDKAAKRIHEA
ncbi:MAG: single-stranded DNA-binding protein, partial [Clostridia bacterium]|nr:single-stranded DNA-binding protein [Clostridia bacterium]